MESSVGNSNTHVFNISDTLRSWSSTMSWMIIIMRFNSTFERYSIKPANAAHNVHNITMPGAFRCSRFPFDEKACDVELPARGRPPQDWGNPGFVLWHSTYCCVTASPSLVQDTSPPPPVICR
jgi:hypothetical protein